MMAGSDAHDDGVGSCVCCGVGRKVPDGVPGVFSDGIKWGGHDTFNTWAQVAKGNPCLQKATFAPRATTLQRIPSPTLMNPRTLDFLLTTLGILPPLLLLSFLMNIPYLDL